MVKIMICGLRRAEDIAAVNRFRPDAAGFICAPGFRRSVRVEQLWQLRRLLDYDIPAAGVFVDQSQDQILALAGAGLIDLVQLHGSEDEDFIRSLKTRLASEEITRARTARGRPQRVPVIKTFKLSGPKDREKVRVSPADYVLLDSGAGSGRTFNWTWTTDLRREFILAGGLNADNIEKAVRLCHPFMVDVSSGAETDGVKDPDKIRLCIEAARRAEK